ncbi:LexA family protein [Flavobacterium sp.]|uniref:LexA family protein n=1 Tax=Flavobacterium sp. TaxID=239 RepID=UPI0039E6E6DC
MLNKKDNLTFFKPDLESGNSVTNTNQGVSAGFPSPALDFMQERIDLNKALSENPLATFFVKVDGHSMVDAGINDKDVLVVDRSLSAQDHSIAVCFIDGEFTVKRIKLEKDGLWLLPENTNYKPIKVDENNQFQIWGIVTYVIKKI